MAQNKIRRSKSAHIRLKSADQSEAPRTVAASKTSASLNFDKRFLSQRAEQKVKQKLQINLQNRQEFKKKSVSIKLLSSRIRNQQSQSSKLEKYTSKAWRTIHSARSEERLNLLKNHEVQNPIRTNLEQKVVRLKAKHRETKEKQLFVNKAIMNKVQRENDQEHERFLNNEKEVSNIKKTIHEILNVWQKQRARSKEFSHRLIQRKSGKGNPISFTNSRFSKQMNQRRQDLGQIQWRID